MNGLDKQVKNGPSLTEALENAGIFYEAQYKVKVVANVVMISTVLHQLLSLYL